MNCTLIGSTSLAFLAVLALVGGTAFQTPAPQDPPKPAPKPEEKPEEQRLRDPKEPLRISCLLPVDKEQAVKQYEPVTKWFTKVLGRPIVYVPVEDYGAALAGLASNKLDLVWLDALHAAKAQEATKNRCQPILARAEDLERRSYFVASRKLVDEGKLKAVAERNPMTLEELAALKPELAKLKLTFGDKLSVSSHLMPRFFLERPEVGLDPEHGFKEPAGFAAKDGDAAVLSAVAAGTYDLGVVSARSWESAKEELRAQLPVVFVTPTYADGGFVIHHRCGPAMPVRIMKAFHLLDRPPAENETKAQYDAYGTAEERKAVLDAFGTKKFVGASVNHFDAVRAALKSAQEKKLVE